MKVIKRRGNEQEFDIQKIYKAVRKANDDKSVTGKEHMTDADIEKVVNTVNKNLAGFNTISTEDIDDFVEKSLMRHNKHLVLKAYIDERNKKQNSKKFTQTEEIILSIVAGDSVLRGDNANKTLDFNPAISDYIAGTVTKSINNKTLPADIVKAHKKGIIHWHDSDYSPLRPQHNCDLGNVEDMLANTFQMGNARIEANNETPFRTVCNLLSQISLPVSGCQYGGQTVSWSHTLPYIDYTRQLIRKKKIDEYNEIGAVVSPEKLDEIIEREVRAEVYEGVKTYQYQILSHSSSNGQTPFVSNNLCLREAKTQRELDDFAMLIEEIFKRRIKGIKDESGNFVSPLFPKLLYWTCDGLNVEPTDPYYSLTELAAECESLRMQPDIVSEPKTREVKKGQIIPSMGCRSLLAPIWEEREYPIDTEFYWMEGGTYDYSNVLGDKIPLRSFAGMEKRKYETGYDKGEVSINFRGNTGWLQEVTEDKVVILEPKIYGRWNNGVITINLPHAALTAVENVRKKNENATEQDTITEFYKILEERMELIRKGLKIRYNRCAEIKGKNSPILWMYGFLARIGENGTVGDLMKKYPQRASISVGFVGLYEVCRALIGESNTTDKGRKLSKEILSKMNSICDAWKAVDHINYSIYGTPEEQTTEKFALANRRDFGLIKYITDKDYVVNSYHVDPRETIDCFSKLKIEGEYLALSSGGAVSYVETADLGHNKEAILEIIKFIHKNILYAEINRKIGVCYECGFVGDIPLTKTEGGDFVFTCPQCGNTNDDRLSIVARLCGYLGKVNAGNTNKGRLDDIFNRTEHTDCKSDYYVK